MRGREGRWERGRVGEGEREVGVRVRGKVREGGGEREVGVRGRWG